MLARNPKTGAPIRILRSDASLWRNKKTLVWLQEQFEDIPWDRWETLCVGVPDIQKWKQQKRRVDYIVLPETNDAATAFFLSLNPADYKMIFITKALIFAIGVQTFRSLQISNVIVLEEMHRMYPFLGTEWDSSKEDAVILVTAVLRISYLAGMPSGFTSNRISSLASESIIIQCIDEQPIPLWYITQYYRPDKTRRGREIKKCLEENAKCSVIDKLVLLNEKDYSEDFPSSSKIEQEIVGKRLTYRRVVEWIVDNVPDNVICIFGNADIYLDEETWRDVWSVNLDNVFLALLRWDVQEGKEPSKLFGPRNDSQDTWGFLSTSVKAKQWDFAALDIPFGKAGCDNSITVEMLRKKFLIVNPALSLKTHHLQLTNYRTYDPTNVVDKPTYMYVDPTGIHDMEPVFDLSTQKFESLEYGTFERRLRSIKSKALDVYCKMLERGERYLWKSNGTNPYPTESVQLLRYTNAFQTPQGLAYGYNRIFVGKDEISKERWSKSELSPIHPSYASDRCFAIPWEPEYATNSMSYIVQFLPKILQLRKQFGRGEFFAPGEGIVPFLDLFEWNEANVPVLQHKPHLQIWCKELIQYPLLAKKEVKKEDVEILRSSLKEKWLANPQSKKWVVMIDGQHITTEMVKAWEATHTDAEWAVVYENRTSPDRMLQKLLGATGFVFYGGSKSISRWGLSWALPVGSSVIEVQNEMDPDGEAAHMSGAAGLTHSLVIVPRASEKVLKEMIIGEVNATLKSLDVLGPLEALKPIVYKPRKSLTGFFGHAGDSFREMIDLWAEKGFVDVVEDPKAVQVWLGGIGKTLLYDRPTLDWLYTAPPDEQSWDLALFGNPVPSDSGGLSKSWFFWPRRPRLVEECVAKGLPQTSWSERSKTLVFYGKIENKVQEKRRKLFDWSSVCDDYVMVTGDATPYPFTQIQYLEKLAHAKFGLCLAGYGKKCHREVECMAMGCVPVITMDVDMDNYATPPQEGVHYIRIISPVDIDSKLKGISEEQWKTMSDACKLWWSDYASAEGSWKLTQKLLVV